MNGMGPDDIPLFAMLKSRMGYLSERQKLLSEGDRRMGSTRAGLTKGGQRIGQADIRPKDADGKPKENGVNLFEGTKEQEVGTSCGLLPGVLLQRLGLNKNPRVEAITRYVTSGAPGGMEDLGTQYNSWVPSTGSNKPTPGDVIVLNYTSGEFAHVAIVKSVDKDGWVTLNSGQGRGAADAALEVKRHVLNDEEKAKYNQSDAHKIKLGKGTYFAGGGNAPDSVGEDPRLVHGWVDLDKLIAYANQK